MKLSTFAHGVAAFSLLIVPSSCRHVKRDYDSHDYYAVHLSPSVQPDVVSSHLGLHNDGPLGELEDHYIFRAGDKSIDYDHIHAALANLRWRRWKREPGALDPHVLDHVLFSQKQQLHKRFPLVKREAFAADSQVPPKTNESPDNAAIQKGLDIAKTLKIEDPIFQEQWHLYNALQPGHDINVTGVWEQGLTGKNSTVCIVDDGLDMDSKDLQDNYFASGSYDFNDHVDDPKPRLADDRHGTRCAGEIAAVRNDVCGVGVAYDGKVSGVRILSKVISDADEAIAMTYAFQENDIYSCSWGPPDDGRSMDGPGVLIRRAMVTGVQKGRKGLGSIYVFAIGNGAANDDNCNFDGYTNSIYSVSVGAVDRKGLHPYYSEKCSAQLVVTYSSGSGDAIHTTDVGDKTCVTSHGGTSAAGPLVAGIYALVLEANPKLTWRDIQWITALTAVKVGQDSDWQMNKAIKKDFSHQFGYGKADAWALVEKAKEWTNVKPQSWFYSPWLHVKHDIPQGDKGLASHFDVTKDMLADANLERVEHVTVTMNVNHTRRGDLSVELHSPSGMVSHLATNRRNDEAEAGYVDWTFMSVAHWGEDGIGEWTVVVKDTIENDHNGTFIDWHLKLWGECIDPNKSTPLPLPTEHDDDDHDGVIPTKTASVGTTSVTLPTKTGTSSGNPDDHPDRPVNSKTSSSKPTESTAPTSSSSATDDSNKSIPSQAGDEKVDEGTATPTASKTASDSTATQTSTAASSTNSSGSSTASPSASSTQDSNFLPRPFPTFGVSKHTQIWIYGAITLILIFLLALGAWAWYMRRKRRWMSRDAYGFEMVNPEDEFAEGDDSARQPLTSGSRAGGGRKKRRAGELYDAFAMGESEGEEDEYEGAEEEREMFELGSDDEDESDGEGRNGRYRDHDSEKQGLDV